MAEVVIARAAEIEFDSHVEALADAYWRLEHSVHEPPGPGGVDPYIAALIDLAANCLFRLYGAAFDNVEATRRTIAVSRPPPWS